MYWFLPLTRDHLSWKATFLMQKGWPHKRGSTVFIMHTLLYFHLQNWFRWLQICCCKELSQGYLLSRPPIARLFDGLTDRRENRRENWAVGAHNPTIGCDFKESDGVGRTLTCQTRSDESHPTIHFYHCAKCIMGWIQQKSYSIGRAVGTKNLMGSEQT